MLLGVITLSVIASTEDKSELQYRFSDDFSYLSASWTGSKTRTIIINKSHVERGKVSSFIGVKNSDGMNEEGHQDDFKYIALPIVQPGLSPTSISEIRVKINEEVNSPSLDTNMAITDKNSDSQLYDFNSGKRQKGMMTQAK